MGCIKQKSAFKHEQNEQIQIILNMCKVSSGRLLSIHTFFYILYPMILLVDSENKKNFTFMFLSKVIPSHAE